MEYFVSFKFNNGNNKNMVLQSESKDDILKSIVEVKDGWFISDDNGVLDVINLNNVTNIRITERGQNRGLDF